MTGLLVGFGNSQGRRSGLELLGWLKKESEFQRIPVVMLSGSGDSADLEKAFELGAVAWMCKPPNRDTVRRLAITIVDFDLEP